VGIPRDTKTLRFWSDRSIPDFILPNGAVRQKIKLTFKVNKEVDHEMVCEWVWDRQLSPAQGGSPRKKVRDFLTHEMIQNWSCPIVLYVHGGAFCLCSSSTHRGLIYSLAIAGEMAIFVPNYRRPPEVSIMDSVDDCFEAYSYLVSKVGIDPARIAVMGDSAGGALVGLLLCRIREKLKNLSLVESGGGTVGVPVIAMPRCGVMLSPWVDLNDPRINKMADDGIIMPEYDYLPYDAIAVFANQSVGELSLDDPRVNLSKCDLSGYPPLYINFGEVEVLRPQIEDFITKCKNDGLKVETHQLKDMIHVGQMLYSVSEIGAEENRRVAQYIRTQTEL
jgi:acetyl esterase/lipase